MLSLTFWPYVALVVILMLSSAGPPLPATVSLAVAAVAARHGHESLGILLVVATLATTAGDILGYCAGHAIGATVSRNRSKWFVHRAGRHVRTALAWLDARGGVGGPLIFVSRWGLSPLAPALNLVIGARHYPFRRFIVWDSAGEALWVARVAIPAFALGQAAGVASLPVALGATVVLGALIVAGAGQITAAKTKTMDTAPITSGAPPQPKRS